MRFDTNLAEELCTNLMEVFEAIDPSITLDVLDYIDCQVEYDPSMTNGGWWSDGVSCEFAGCTKVGLTGNRSFDCAGCTKLKVL